MLKSAATALPGLSIEPVASRSTVQDGVYQRLSEALMNGRLDPGQQLTIASIADMCGTSHMPVREALRRLAAEGALEVASTGSAHVPAASRGRSTTFAKPASSMRAPPVRRRRPMPARS